MVVMVTAAPASLLCSVVAVIPLFKLTPPVIDWRCRGTEVGGNAPGLVAGEQLTAVSA